MHLPISGKYFDYRDVPAWRHTFKEYWTIVDPNERQQLLLWYFKSLEVVHPTCNDQFVNIASKIDQSDFMILFVPGMSINGASKKKLNHLQSCFIAEYLLTVYDLPRDVIHPPQKEIKKGKPSLATHNKKDELEVERNCVLKGILGENHWAIARDKISMRNKKRTVGNNRPAANASQTISPSSTPAAQTEVFTSLGSLSSSVATPSHAYRETATSPAFISPSSITTTLPTPPSSLSSVAETADKFIRSDHSFQ